MWRQELKLLDRAATYIVDTPQNTHTEYAAFVISSLQLGL